MLKNRKSLFAIIALVVAITFGTTAYAGTPVVYKGFANPNSVISVEKLREMQDEFVVIDFSKKKKDLIPGAVFIDRDQLFVKKNGVKLMRPPKSDFVKVLGDYGLTIDTPVVVYSDDNNIFAARLYWDLKALGHKDVRLLDGGVVAWKAAGHDTVGKSATLPPATYTALSFDKEAYADIETVKAAKTNVNYCVLDTRSAKEYKAGRIPGAVNINYTSALNEDMTFKTYDELRAIYKDIPTDRTIVAHCLGGIRAAHSWFVLSELLGYKHVKNYDGSWWEYEKSGEPIEK